MAMAADWVTVTGASPVITLRDDLVGDSAYDDDSDGVTALRAATTLRVATMAMGRWTVAAVIGRSVPWNSWS